MKNAILKLVIGLVALLIIVGCYGLYSYHKSVDIGAKVVSVIVRAGDGFNLVADSLIAKGVVDSRRILKLAARQREVDRKLIPGRYDFTGTNSIKSVLDKLEQGDFLRLRVTIPEGSPIWRTASIMAARLETDSAQLMALNFDSQFVAPMKVGCLEGYLFPETYFIPWGTVIEDIIGEMVAMYRAQTDSLEFAKAPNNLSVAEVMILASIIEAEAIYDDEKSKIASVYHNRLKRRMKLDADPTVIYGLGGLDRPLWRRDLRKDTPYNTYLHKGLPPTAINSPGLAAIRAAIYPIESEFLFFVADGTGRHRFSKTNAEHNRARREIKRGQSQSDR